VTIEAVPGSPIGPGTIENGYILEEISTGHRLYYEPHGFYSPSLKDRGTVDVAITPIVDIEIPLLGPVIRGGESALKLCELLRPRAIVPTAAGGDVIYEGILSILLRSKGDLESFRELLKTRSPGTRVLDPRPWQPFEVGPAASYGDCSDSI
jgi:L-ascorbate metabolism protein UlaG (beta-lactamase superfamily)